MNCRTRQRQPSAVGRVRGRDRVEPDPILNIGLADVGLQRRVQRRRDVNLGAASLGAQNHGLGNVGAGNLGFATSARQYRFRLGQV